MKFIYSAIGDNTPENREHLEKLGYKKHFLDRESDPLLHTWIGDEFITQGYSSLPNESVWNPDHPDSCSDKIDCRPSDALFQAVTAMREDSDRMQIFIDDNGTLIRCHRTSIKIFPEYKNPRKLTLAELKEHFKKG